MFYVFAVHTFLNPSWAPIFFGAFIHLYLSISTYISLSLSLYLNHIHGLYPSIHLDAYIDYVFTRAPPPVVGFHLSRCAYLYFYISI